MGFEYGEELREKCRMRRPCRSGYEVTVGNCICHLQCNVSGTGEFDLRSAGGEGIDAFAGDDTRGREQLCAVAVCGDGFVRAIEVANDVEDTAVQAEVYG